MENAWTYLQANKRSILVFDTYKEIRDKGIEAWNLFAVDSSRIHSTTNREWAKVN